MIGHSYKATNKVLSGLPDSYTVYNNVFVNESKLDRVVMGNNGVFIILDRSLNKPSGCFDVDKEGYFIYFKLYA